MLLFLFFFYGRILHRFFTIFLGWTSSTSSTVMSNKCEQFGHVIFLFDGESVDLSRGKKNISLIQWKMIRDFLTSHHRWNDRCWPVRHIWFSIRCQWTIGKRQLWFIQLKSFNQLFWWGHTSSGRLNFVQWFEWRWKFLKWLSLFQYILFVFDQHHVYPIGGKNQVNT